MSQHVGVMLGLFTYLYVALGRGSVECMREIAYVILQELDLFQSATDGVLRL